MKRAFTLIELLVYMAIMGFIIVVAGQVFKDSTVMRVRSQNMIASAEQIGKLSSLLNEDMSQMGTKAWGKNENNNYNVSVESKVYMDATGANPDFSSYNLTHSTESTDSLDNLVFRKISFDDEGKSLGVREISWYVSGDSIYRSCRTIEGTDTENDSCPSDVPLSVLMGTDIKKFYLMPSVPGMSLTPGANVPEDTLFGKDTDLGFSLKERTEGERVSTSLGVSPANGNKVTLYNFVGNSEGNTTFNQVYLGEKDVMNWKECSLFALRKGETYAVEFKMPLFEENNKLDIFSSQFLPGKDHIAVGLRDRNGGTVGPIDVLLYPSQSESKDEDVNTKMLRRAEFSLENDTTACVALTFAFYSPNARKGRLQFSEFRVFHVNTKAFHFPKEGEADYDPNYGTEAFADVKERIRQKENAKAFQLILETSKGKTGKDEKTRTSSAEGNGMVILTPNNGIKAKGS